MYFDTLPHLIFTWITILTIPHLIFTWIIILHITSPDLHMDYDAYLTAPYLILTSSVILSSSLILSSYFTSPLCTVINQIINRSTRSSSTSSINQLINQVQIWRSGLLERPPDMNETHIHWHRHERKYADLDPTLIPKAESLQDTIDR